ARQGWAPSHPAPVREGALAEPERRTARLIHRICRGFAAARRGVVTCQRTYVLMVCGVRQTFWPGFGATMPTSGCKPQAEGATRAEAGRGGCADPRERVLPEQRRCRARPGWRAAHRPRG